MTEALLGAIRDLAQRTNVFAGEARWYLFGSAKSSRSDIADIDLLVICDTSQMADAVRRLVDLDSLSRPIHLSILTQAEQDEVSFVERQNCTRIA